MSSRVRFTFRVYLVSRGGIRGFEKGTVRGLEKKGTVRGFERGAVRAFVRGVLRDGKTI